MWKNKQMNDRNKRVWTYLQGFLFFHGLWWLAAICIQTRALPGPIEVYKQLPQFFKKGLLCHLGMSCYRLFLALGIAFVLGSCIGLFMGKNVRMNQLLNPLIYFTYPIPKTALLPILMLLFGLGEGSKITLIVLITIFQVIVVVRDSTLQIEEQLYHVLKSLGANRRQCFFQVTLPAILPDILSCLRVAVGTGLSVLFFAENYGTKYGLGYYVQDCWGRLNYTAMYGGIWTLSFLGFLLFIGIDGMNYLFCKGR